MDQQNNLISDWETADDFVCTADAFDDQAVIMINLLFC